MFALDQTAVFLALGKQKIQTRPNAGHGLWLIFLLPLALILSTASHPVISTATYKLSSIFSIGLIFSSLLFFYNCFQNKRLNSLFNVGLTLSCFMVAGLFKICLHRGLVFSVWSAATCTFIYYKVYFMVLQKLPKCFSLGEAAICSQSYILLLYFTVLNVFNHNAKSMSHMQMSTVTLQVGLLGLSAIIILSYKFGVTNPIKFYALSLSVIVGIILLPLQVLLKTNPLVWILDLLVSDLQMNKVVLYWALFSLLAVVFVNRRIKKAQRATTAMRKVFHFLSVVVFIPGLLYNCCLLYLASGVVLAIFFMLEILRVLHMPPLAEALQNGLVIFGDEKDEGIIAFTPMYLLAGCSLPLWIHPSPCDVTNSAIFCLLPLLSGLLTIGIGDTAASIVGSKIGKYFWKGSRKTIEGTIACILSQLLFIYAFIYFDLVKLYTNLEYFKVVFAVIFTSIVEAKTDQVDNLVLPFIMYIILVV